MDLKKWMDKVARELAKDEYMETFERRMRKVIEHIKQLPDEEGA